LKFNKPSDSEWPGSRDPTSGHGVTLRKKKKLRLGHPWEDQTLPGPEKKKGLSQETRGDLDQSK